MALRGLRVPGRPVVCSAIADPGFLRECVSSDCAIAPSGAVAPVRVRDAAMSTWTRLQRLQLAPQGPVPEPFLYFDGRPRRCESLRAPSPRCWEPLSRWSASEFRAQPLTRLDEDILQADTEAREGARVSRGQRSHFFNSRSPAFTIPRTFSVPAEDAAVKGEEGRKETSSRTLERLRNFCLRRFGSGKRINVAVSGKEDGKGRRSPYVSAPL